MGLFWQGIPHSFFPAIRNALGTSFTAIESGTYKGHTSRKFAHFADQVITIEADFDYFLKSKKSSSDTRTPQFYTVTQVN